MKTDKELLRLAAKAVGLEAKGQTERGISTKMNGACMICFWNPLTDDADAFRLAVDLGITPNIYSTCVAAKRYVGDKICCEEDFGNDKHAATRRAIVRAAADIGEQVGKTVQSAEPYGEFEQYWDK